MDKARFFFLFVSIILIIALHSSSPGSPSPQETVPPQEPKVGLLKLLGISASPESIDYVQHKTQFQLHTLLTEQRHPKTWNLSERSQKDPVDGLKMLFSVDDDISRRLDSLASDKQAFEPLVSALRDALLSQDKIYIYGCGATGREERIRASR